MLSARCLEGHIRGGYTLLMPSGPAFGTQPRMGPGLSSERQDHGTGRLGTATPCAPSRPGWSRMLVQPFDDATRLKVFSSPSGLRRTQQRNDSDLVTR